MPLATDNDTRKDQYVKHLRSPDIDEPEACGRTPKRQARMNDFARSIGAALTLIGEADAELLGIVALSVRVSLTAGIVALLIGAPFGALLAITRFRGRQVVIVLTNALLGLPPVVVGLALYLLLSRSGPLGAAGLLFTPTAMVIAQTLLATPIVVALVHRPAACCGPSMATSRGSTDYRRCAASACCSRSAGRRC